MQKLFSRTNYLLLAVGLVVMLVGYVALGQPPEDSVLSLSVAPLLLVLAYCVILPLAIILKGKNKQGN